MHSSATNTRELTTLCSPDALEFDDFICISRWAAREHGAAALVLAMVWGAAKQNDGKGMFMSVGKLGALLEMSPRQVHRHLDNLVNGGPQGDKMKCLQNKGRQRPQGGRQARRTCTYVINPAMDRLYSEEKFFRFPRWLLRSVKTWGERIVLAAVIDREHLRESVESCEVRNDFTMRELESHTGLSRPSIKSACRWLADQEIIEEFEESWATCFSLTLNDEKQVWLEDGKPVGMATKRRRGA